MGIKRLAASALLACGLSAGGLAVGADVASAHLPGTNGCTLSPDSGYAPVYYNFHDACDLHDLCYLNKPYGDSSAGRRECDDRFRTEMRRWCANRYSSWWQGPLRSNCYGVAEVYYQAVRALGGPFF